MSPAQRLLDVFAMVGVHLQHAADPLAAVFDRVQNLAAARHHTRINTHKGQRADKRVGHDLEGEPGEGLVIRRMALDRLVRAHLDALDRRDVGWRRQVVDNGIEQRLHALVLEGRAAQHRDKGAADRTLADTPLQRRFVGLFAAEIGFERRVILLDRSLDQTRM